MGIGAMNRLRGHSRQHLLDLLSPYPAVGRGCDARQRDAAEAENASLHFAGKVRKTERLFERVGNASTRGAFAHPDVAPRHVAIEPVELWRCSGLHRLTP